ncbi:MAG: AarF/ABC1/UbiB kinase family protein [Planctomycetota bacterium]
MRPRPLRLIRNLNRTREIVQVLVAEGFGDLVSRLRLRPLNPFRRRGERAEGVERLTAGARVRRALEQLGPTAVKFGQLLSTRPDVIPAELIDELSLLREHVSPFDGALAVRQIEQAFGRPVDDLFAEFDPEPLGAGSLAQVHRAVTSDGELVAVKVRRPQAIDEVERDLELLHDLAELVAYRVPEWRVFDPRGLVRHFTRTVRRELDFDREARTIEEFGRLFADTPGFRVPRVRPDLSASAVLTMEFIEGHGPSELADRSLTLPVAAGEIAATGADCFMRQVFELGFFHGDPHPGNIRVLADGSLCLLDYGMVGYLDGPTRDGLVDLFAAIARQDVGEVAAVMTRIGEPLAEIDERLLRADVRDFLGAYYGVALDRIDVGRLLEDFLAVLTGHQIRCPGDLSLLIRATVALEGTGRRIDPGFNFAERLGPFVERVVRDRYRPDRVASRVAEEALGVARAARGLPGDLSRAVRRVADGDVETRVEIPGLEKVIVEVDRTGNRIVVGLIMAALIVASSLVIRGGGEFIWFAVPLFVASSLLGLWLVYGIVRSGSL